MSKLTECPYCGSNMGYYRTGRVYGSYACNYPFQDGQVPDNSEMHSGIRYKENKSCYCIECHKKIPYQIPSDN